MTPQEIVSVMTKQDHFSKWLGLEIDSVGAGYCKLHYTVRKEMLNGFGSIHGGVLFSASDSAFAFACNTHGIITVALEVSISFVLPAGEGDILYAEAKEIHTGNKTALYDIHTRDAAGNLIALFRGTGYRTGKAIENGL
jgi:acyl-CoA thioesterase